MVGKTRPSVINRPIVGFPVHQCYDRLDVRRLAGVGQYLIVGIPRNRGRGRLNCERQCEGAGERYASASNGSFCRVPSVDIVGVGHCIIILRRQRLPVHCDGDAGFLRCAVVGQVQVSGQRSRQHGPADAFPGRAKAAIFFSQHLITGRAGLVVGGGAIGVGVLVGTGMRTRLHRIRPGWQLVLPFRQGNRSAALPIGAGAAARLPQHFEEGSAGGINCTACALDRAAGNRYCAAEDIHAPVVCRDRAAGNRCGAFEDIHALDVCRDRAAGNRCRAAQPGAHAGVCRDCAAGNRCRAVRPDHHAVTGIAVRRDCAAGNGCRAGADFHAVAVKAAHRDFAAGNRCRAERDLYAARSIAGHTDRAACQLERAVVLDRHAVVVLDVHIDCAAFQLERAAVDLNGRIYRGRRLRIVHREVIAVAVFRAGQGDILTARYGQPFGERNILQQRDGGRIFRSPLLRLFPGFGKLRVIGGDAANGHAGLITFLLGGMTLCQVGVVGPVQRPLQLITAGKVNLLLFVLCQH